MMEHAAWGRSNPSHTEYNNLSVVEGYLLDIGNYYFTFTPYGPDSITFCADEVMY